MTRGTPMMRWMLALGVAALLLPAGLFAADEPAKDAKPDEKPADAAAAPPKEESSVTDHTITLGGQTFPYKAIASTTLLKNEKDEPTALLYSTAYVRSDVKDVTRRPVAFLYNGGPGSSSIWLHMGSFAPKRVITANAESTPPPPYRLVDNTQSLLDKADLVFIDPIGTGFSRAVGKSQDKDFWGVDQDVQSIAQFIVTWVGRNNRWNSPKFLIGESYGTFRSAALANYMQARDGLYFNGIVLVSNVLDLGTISFLPGSDQSYVFYVPSYAATAWYHKLLKEQPADLNGFLAEARRWAETDYASALQKGSRLTAAEKGGVAKALSRYTGLSEDYLVKADLRVNLAQFMQELQRSRRLTTGRLDARFTGATYDLLGEFANYDPQDVAITGAFTAAWNSYVREELKFGKDKVYRAGAQGAGEAWDWHHAGGGGFGFPGAPNVEGDLIQALIANPHLKVEVENGYYDLATPFFATEYTMEHLFLPEPLQKNIAQQYYEAGHMMYVHDEDLAKLKANVGRFIESASSH